MSARYPRVIRALRASAALLLTAAAAAPAAAQSAPVAPAEFDSWRVPGWSFTPGVAIGTVYDTNVALSGPDVNGQTASDKLFHLEPFGQLEFFSPRTQFSSGYRGELRRYFELSDLDGTDHRAYVSLRQRVNRRVSVYADESYTRLPTTDLLELNGVPFFRVGSRYNNIGGGVDARLTKSVDLSTHYEMSWVDFDRTDNPLTGGLVNGVIGILTHRFTDRARAGGEYSIRWADLNQGTRQFTYQDVGGIFEYKTGERTNLSTSGGMTFLLDRTLNLTRSFPYAKATLIHQAQRATFGADYQHSYTPSFYLGGSHRSQEVRGYVNMPFSRNRLYVQESAAWRRSSPLVALAPVLDSSTLVTADPALVSTWIRSGIGYGLQRWARIEGYYQFTSQDNQLAGGRVSRHLAGVQLVVSEPMRIR